MNPKESSQSLKQKWQIPLLHNHLKVYVETLEINDIKTIRIVKLFENFVQKS